MVRVKQGRLQSRQTSVEHPTSNMSFIRRSTLEVRRSMFIRRLASTLPPPQSTSKRPTGVELRLKVHPFFLVRGGVIALHAFSHPVVHSSQALDQDPHR